MLKTQRPLVKTARYYIVWALTNKAEGTSFALPLTGDLVDSRGIAHERDTIRSLICGLSGAKPAFFGQCNI